MEKLDKKVSFRLPENTKEKWWAAAIAADMNLGDWIRSQVSAPGADPVLTQKKTPLTGTQTKYVPADPALVREVAKIGNNLNQIARWVNTHKKKAETLQVLAQLMSLKEQVARLSDAD